MVRETPASVKCLSVEAMLGPVDQVPFQRISWAVVGGESGAHGPMEVESLRDVRDRRHRECVRFFFKQWHKID